MGSSKTSSSRSSFVSPFLSRWIPRRHRDLPCNPGVDSLYRGQLRVVVCRIAEGLLVRASDWKRVDYSASIRFWFLLIGVDHSGVHPMGETRFLPRELRPFKPRTRRSPPRIIVLRIQCGVRQRIRRSPLQLPSWWHTDPTCIQYRGLFVLVNLSFSKDSITVPLCALAGFVWFFLISSCLILQFWRVDVYLSATRTRNCDPDASAGKEIAKKGRKGGGAKKVDVELVDLALDIYKPSPRRGNGRTLNALRTVSTKFYAGELNIILGPSGSGKSLLLNTMTRRLRSSLFTRRRMSGTMLSNGIQPTDKEMRSLCS